MNNNMIVYPKPLQIITFYKRIHTLIFPVTQFVCFQCSQLNNFAGFGKLFKVVSALQQECDKQSKLIIMEFSKQRLLERRVSMINEIERSTSQMNASGVVDPKEIDLLLGEITIMHSRYHLYLRFVRRRVTVSGLGLV